jgi:DNA-binding transcriptional regulator YiaG|tara:strand:- start:423 stop:605 length:183 start_codon:yes stop_codon:yes gene_type:complete
MTNTEIRKSRAALRLTQPEFAKRLRVSLRIVTKWESDGCPLRWDELIENIVRDEGVKATS